VFVERFYRDNQPTAGRQIEYMVRGTQTPLADPLHDVAAFYKADPTWFIEVETMLRTAPLFSFFEHPLFAVLAKDYN